MHRKNKKGKLNTNLLHNVANLLLLAVKLLMRLSGIRPVSLESFINFPQKCSFVYGYVAYLIICTSPPAIHSFCKFVNKKSKFKLIMCMTKCFYDIHILCPFASSDLANYLSKVKSGAMENIFIKFRDSTASKFVCLFFQMW